MAVGKENTQGQEATRGGEGVSTEKEGVKAGVYGGRYAAGGGKKKRLKAQAGNK